MRIDNNFAEGVPSQKDVLHYLVKAKAIWRGLGVELDIKQLQAFKGDDKHCLMQVVGTWMEREAPPPSWESLVKALCGPLVDRKDLAKTIAKEHNVEMEGENQLN